MCRYPRYSSLFIRVRVGMGRQICINWGIKAGVPCVYGPDCAEGEITTESSLWPYSASVSGEPVEQ